MLSCPVSVLNLLISEIYGEPECSFSVSVIKIPLAHIWLHGGDDRDAKLKRLQTPQMPPA
jgi:hypothetical protein